MTNILWWIGAIHVAAYSIVGTAFAVTWLSWKAHALFGYNAKIIQWHVARSRWARRHTDGLTDSEWEKGEPRP